MPVIKPFRGLRYADTRPEAMARMLAPPFDMIGGEQQRALLAISEHNVAWLTVADDGPGYPGVGARFARWRETGILRSDVDPAFYAYEQSVGEATLRGFLAAVRLGAPAESAVHPHENTFAEPIVDRLALLKSTRCGLEPVFGIHTDTGGRVAEVLRQATAIEPLFCAQTPDGATHRLRSLTDPDQQHALMEALADTQVVIADGHHRWAAANALRDEQRASGATDPGAPHEFGLMLLVEESGAGVQCGAFHRVIHRLPEGVDPTRLDEHLGTGFTVQGFPTEGLSDEEAARRMVERITSDPGPHVFGCCWATGAALVRIRDLEALLPTASRPIDPIIREFDVALLHRLILRPRLGCHGDYGPQACAVVFEKDPVAAWRKVTSGNALMAWFVRPAPIAAVLRAAFAGLTVPQKATHFHPKPPSGMVMYDLGEQ
ncbi:MAG: DUF1015 domain-containing protein [Armatimonadetes bacterium]|nr:DUF1015 domain-containing protein [Armatimonadota bacterium]